MYSKFPEKTVKTIITDLLSEQDEYTNKIMQDIFYNLCKNNCHYKCVKLLIESEKIDVIAYNYALIYALKNGYIEIVKLCIISGKVDITTQDNYAIRYACEYGHIEVVKILIDSGKVDVTAQNNYAIRYACEHGYVEVVNLLLSTKKVDISAQYNHAICYASSNGHLEVVRLLLSTGNVDVTARDNFAIKYASYNGHLEVVKLLLLTGKIDVKRITDVKVLDIINQIMPETKYQYINSEKMIQMMAQVMAQIMKMNNILKIVIKNQKIQLTTKRISTIELSEIINLMKKFNIVKCEFDDQSSIFKYETIVKISTMWDSTTCIIWARENGEEKLQSETVTFSNMSLREQRCKWGFFTCSYAALNGNLDLLKWARENGCEWDSWTCSNAALNGHLDVLKWARENGCQWDYMTCSNAALNGHLDVLKWAIENGCGI